MTWRLPGPSMHVFGGGLLGSPVLLEGTNHKELPCGQAGRDRPGPWRGSPWQALFLEDAPSGEGFIPWWRC